MRAHTVVLNPPVTCVTLSCPEISLQRNDKEDEMRAEPRGV